MIITLVAAEHYTDAASHSRSLAVIVTNAAASR
jgi:hypothetical protein